MFELNAKVRIILFAWYDDFNLHNFRMLEFTVSIDAAQNIFILVSFSIL